jgi:hypothetical protein
MLKKSAICTFYFFIRSLKRGSVPLKELVERQTPRMETGGCQPGLPDFYWYMIPKPGKVYQMNTKCTKCTQNVPNGHKISQMDI